MNLIFIPALCVKSSSPQNTNAFPILVKFKERWKKEVLMHDFVQSYLAEMKNLNISYPECLLMFDKECWNYVKI